MRSVWDEALAGRPDAEVLEAATRLGRVVVTHDAIMEQTDVTEDDSNTGRMCSDVFGPGWQHLRIAHPSTADRIGLEITSPFASTAPSTSPFRPQSYERTYSAGVYT